MNWFIYIGILNLVTILTLQTISSELSRECTSANKSEVSDTRVLSRRKRFLVFPDGSSLQLVFCCQTSALVTIGDIFLYGNTAALAWNLPTDPEFFRMIKEDVRYAKRRQDLNEIYYLDENGKVLAKVPYKRKPIINPAFAKRSVENQNITFKEKLKLKIDRKKMHKKQERREYLKQEHMSEKTAKFHRSTRVGLYEKIEKLFTAIGRNGRQCVLYKLCKAKRSPVLQGTFLQELTRIIFTLPKGAEFDKKEHREYDIAHHTSIKDNDCSRLYPGCDNLVLSEKVL